MTKFIKKLNVLYNVLLIAFILSTGHYLTLMFGGGLNLEMVYTTVLILVSFAIMVIALNWSGISGYKTYTGLVAIVVAFSVYFINSKFPDNIDYYSISYKQEREFAEIIKEREYYISYTLSNNKFKRFTNVQPGNLEAINASVLSDIKFKQLVNEYIQIVRSIGDVDSKVEKTNDYIDKQDKAIEVLKQINSDIALVDKKFALSFNSERTLVKGVGKVNFIFYRSKLDQPYFVNWLMFLMISLTVVLSLLSYKVHQVKFS